MFLEEYVLMKRKTKKPPYIKGGAKSKIFVGGVAEWEQSLSLLPGAKALRVKGFFAWLPGRAAGIKGVMRPSKSGVFILLSVSFAFLSLFASFSSFFSREKKEKKKIQP